MQSGDSKTASRAWLREERRIGGRAVWPVVLLGLLNTAMAVGQAWCVAMLLAGALTGHSDDTGALLGGFAVLAMLRAIASITAESGAFNAGAAARRIRAAVTIQLLSLLSLHSLLANPPTKP